MKPYSISGFTCRADVVAAIEQFIADGNKRLVSDLLSADFDPDVIDAAVAWTEEGQAGWWVEVDALLDRIAAGGPLNES